MARLVITADIHGSLSAWKKIRSLMKPGDHLAVAGDLFDTIYGSPGQDDYQPDTIKKEFQALASRALFVYGNCDREEDADGYGYQKHFTFNGFSILLNHGHRSLPDLTDYHIIIEGHSHVPRLVCLMGKVFLNPGSPTSPRCAYGTYAILAGHHIKLYEFTHDTLMCEMDLSTVIL